MDVLPGTRFELLEGSGHAVYLERREELFSILRAFMAAKSLDFEMPEAAPAEA